MRILSFLARQCDLLRESDNKLLPSRYDGAALQGQESTRSPDPARFRRADSVWVRLVGLWRSNLSTQNGFSFVSIRGGLLKQRACELKPIMTSAFRLSIIVFRRQLAVLKSARNSDDDYQEAPPLV